MRWLLSTGFSLLLLVIFGCGGGGGTGTTPSPPNLLTLNYLDSRTTIPSTAGKSRTTASEEYLVNVKMRTYSGSPMTHLTVGIPYNGRTLGMDGPYALSVTDGDFLGYTPLKVYWGSSQTVPAGQPLLLLPGQMLPGYARPSAPLSIYAGSINFDTPVPIAGAYFMAADNGVAQTWQIPADQQMVAPVDITEPNIIAVNSLQSIHVTWGAVPGALGYMVVADSIHDSNNSNGEQAVWTSASQPIYFEALDDFVPYLLPSSVHAVDVPAGIFRNCQTVLIRVLAHSNPCLFTKTTPNLRMVSGAITNQVFSLYEQ